jgi:putative ABC transport system ATP-binding protein
MKSKFENKTDVVCGIDLHGCRDVFEEIYKNKKYYFCDEDCKDRFKASPEKFMGQPIIKLRNVKKSFMLGKVPTHVLNGISFNIWPGEFVALIGPSGSGKSTTLNMIGLLDTPTSGHIHIKDQNASHLKDFERAKLRSQIFGFVFQQYNLIPWLTAYENVTVPLIFSGKKILNNELVERFNEIGLGSRMHHKPAELSGGEQQRVALLRALSIDPEIILGDEPTGNLDSVTGKKILEMLFKLNKKEGKTLVIVTHDSGIAKEADQIISIQDGVILRDHHGLKKKYISNSINYA